MYTSMYITELQARRRIWVYLPDDYAISGKRYPVLYMQDGQNLFDAASSFSGEWGVDEYLDSITGAGIVVGIDNGGDTRINEYNPNDNEEFGKGLGKEYLRRVVEILKPFVDDRFRTLADAHHTAIAGSSMGGLISFYAGLYYPDIFGAVGVFSPSFWIVQDLQAQLKKLAGSGYSDQRYFFYGGGQEEEEMTKRLQEVRKIMETKLKAQVTICVNEKGTHSEWAWRKVFPEFYAWWQKKIQ
jgi:predicted alpha/beta superfamily hydrolase